METQTVDTTPTAPAVTEYDREPLHVAFQILAGRCNYASTNDGAGFSKFDADFGHRLAQMPAGQWSPKMLQAAYKLARKYRGQLAGAGHPYEDIPEPPALEALEARFATKRKVVKYDGQNYVVEFAYDAALVDAVKKIPGARFVRIPNPAWSIPPNEQTRALLRGFTEAHGFEIDTTAAQSIASAPAITDPVDLRRCDVHPTDEDALALAFPYDYQIAAEARRFGTWQAQERLWRVPIMRQETIGEFRAFVAAWDVKVSEAAEERIVVVLAKREEALVASRAVDAELEIEGLARTLFPFQRAGTRYALDKKRVIIADEMGLGKTSQGIATVLAADAFPCVVACPASLKINWKREWKACAPHVSVAIVDGMTPQRWVGGLLRTAPDVLIVNYDILQPHIASLKEMGIKSVICDEAHYIKNGKAQRSTAVEQLCDGVEWILMLTGTPVLNRPAELIFPLKVLRRLGDLGGSRFFRTRYCGWGSSAYGGSNGAANLGELNDALRACCYVRRLKSQVLTELPAKMRTPLALPIDNVREYKQTEADFIHWVRDNASRKEKFLRELEARVDDHRRRAIESGVTPEQATVDAAEFRRQAIRDNQESAVERALRAEVLVRMGVLEQCAVKGKLAAARAWVRDFLESGEKLVLFCSHTEPLQVLAKEFGAPTISGSDSSDARQAAVDRFQTDETCRLIVCNMQAGGVGITLTAASNVAFLELGWTPAAHDQAEDRCHRIGQRDQVTAWYLLGEGTIDQYKAAKLDEKRAVVDAATEGGDVTITSVFGDVLQMLAGVSLEA